MNCIERRLETPEKEYLDPHHFYAAYIFGGAHERQDDVAAVVSNAQKLGYPVRYWWLSEAMALDGAPDRLIVCAHHDSFNDTAGLDLYDALKEQEAQWDFLEAASVGEYGVLGRPAEQAEAILMPDGTSLFPPAAEESL